MGVPAQVIVDGDAKVLCGVFIVDVGIPAQVLFDGDAKVLCGVCGLTCVAVGLVGVLQDVPGYRMKLS